MEDTSQEPIWTDQKQALFLKWIEDYQNKHLRIPPKEVEDEEWNRLYFMDLKGETQQ